MSVIQVATRIDEAQGKKFRTITNALGTTPSEALRMFIAAFNATNGFPFDVRLNHQEAQAFETEAEATEFATRLARKIAHETR